jgi:DNA replication protein DnaC
MEDVWTTPGRGVAKATIRELSTCRWVEHQHNVICIGKTGCGKSYLAAALAQAACRNGLRTLYSRVPRLVEELAIARADGTLARVLARLAKLQVLVLDDFLLAPLKDAERRDLLEILEDRYGHSSTIITSQLPTDKWHAALGDPTVADAICDRVVHNAHVLILEGQSGRKRKGLSTNT